MKMVDILPSWDIFNSQKKHEDGRYIAKLGHYSILKRNMKMVDILPSWDSIQFSKET